MQAGKQVIITFIVVKGIYHEKQNHFQIFAVKHKQENFEKRSFPSATQVSDILANFIACVFLQVNNLPRLFYPKLDQMIRVWTFHGNQENEIQAQNVARMLSKKRKIISLPFAFQFFSEYNQKY